MFMLDVISPVVFPAMAAIPILVIAIIITLTVLIFKIFK